MGGDKALHRRRELSIIIIIIITAPTRTISHRR